MSCWAHTPLPLTAMPQVVDSVWMLGEVRMAIHGLVCFHCSSASWMA